MQHDLVIRGGTIVDGLGGEPFVGDVAVDGGKIVAVGPNLGAGRKEIEAQGLLVTPGFVDIHTHYDGQVIWENRLSPSSGHGVTTALMGNCGVGFAPARTQDHRKLIQLMEGVEDIPGVVMTEGLTWDWESYPEYLDAVAARPHDINIASYLPHAPLRVYVMGDRAAAGEKATPEDIARMAELTAEAIDAGAMGFATSRTLFHRSSSGDKIPTLDAAEEELTAIAAAMQARGKGILQIATDYNAGTDLEGEFAMLQRIAGGTDRALTLPMAQIHSNPQQWRDLLGLIEKGNAQGVKITAQALPRGIGLLFGLELSAHPFCLTPSYQAIEHLPLAERLERMRDPELRARMISEQPVEGASPLTAFVDRYENMFEMGNPLNYEPDPKNSIASRAERLGVSPQNLAYDLLLAHEGHATFFMPFANYADGNLDTALEMFRHPNLVPGLGDGGAHYGIICDASYTTFLLSYWTRDRQRGERMRVPEVVKAMSHDTAAMIGLDDRGVIAPGYNADINVIDYDNLALHAPKVAFDLPAGGRRLTQRAEGFVATIVNGQVVYRNGVPTGALPGELVRGAQSAPVAQRELAEA